VTAQLKDGSDAQSLIVFGAFDQCKSTRFDTTGTGDSLTLAVGSTMVSCQVLLAPAGDEIKSSSARPPHPRARRGSGRRSRT
jgi:hypothetical protein